MARGVSMSLGSEDRHGVSKWEERLGLQLRLKWARKKATECL